MQETPAPPHTRPNALQALNLRLGDLGLSWTLLVCIVLLAVIAGCVEGQHSPIPAGMRPAAETGPSPGAAWRTIVPDASRERRPSSRSRIIRAHRLDME